MAVTRTKKITRNTVDNKQLPIYYCRKCQKTFLVKTEFYEANNTILDANGRLSICRTCMHEIYENYLTFYNSQEKALYEVCRDLDVVFSNDALEQATSQLITIEKKGHIGDVLGYYFSKLRTVTTKNKQSFIGRFKDSDKFIYATESVNKIIEEKQKKTPDEEMKELKEKWGSHTESEYEFLENQLHQLEISFEVPNFSMVMLMKDICMLNLSIEKERQQGGDALKLIESRVRLMEKANMQPVQQTGLSENEAITFGTLIKKWENEKPIIPILDNEMKNYIDTKFIGQILKIEGITNEITEKLDKEDAPYIIDIENPDNIIEEEKDD